MIKSENGKRVFVVRGGEGFTPIEGGGGVASETLYFANGKKSQYPTILMNVGDKVFVVDGKIGPKDKVYKSATNRKIIDPTFDYVAYACKFEGEHGFVIRCVERKNKTLDATSANMLKS